MRFLWFALLLTWLYLPGIAQTDTDSIRYILQEDMIYDLKALNSFVKRNHPKPFYAHTEPEVDSFHQVLAEALPDSLSEEDFWRVCYKMINFYNDAHTRIRYTEHYQKHYLFGGKFFPLQVRFSGDTLRVVSDLQNGVSIPKGSQITRINGWSIPDLKHEVSLFARGENDEIDQLMINDDIPYYFWLAFDWGDAFNIDWVTPGGEVRHALLKGMSITKIHERTNWMPRNQKIMDYEYLNDSTAFLYIKNFFSTSKKIYKRLFKGFFLDLSTRPNIKYLIIDNRTNDGGDNTYAEELCRYFADQPFRSVARSYWYATPQFKENFKQAFIPKALRWMRPLYVLNKHTRAIWRAEEGQWAEVNYKMVKPFKESKRFQGEVILLNDVGTFSAGSMFAAMFEDYDMGTSIGRPTGNISSFFANNIMRGPTIALPHPHRSIDQLQRTPQWR
jgi:hypothetical protein